MYWLFNSKRFDFKGNEKETIELHQSRKFSGQVNDKVVFFSFDSGKNFFTHVYAIGSIAPAEGEVFYSVNIQLELILEKTYEDNKEIENYIYSFPRIKYFDKYLYRHFTREYYRLSKTEFNAIDNDEIFVARTILGTALNSMHRDHRQAFSVQLVENYPEIMQNKFDYASIVTFFFQYFEYSVLLPARQLRDAYSVITEMTETEILQEIAFADPEKSGRSIQLIQSQSEITAQNERIYQEVMQSIGPDQIYLNERIFQNLFRNRGLPIDLN